MTEPTEQPQGPAAVVVGDEDRPASEQLLDLLVYCPIGLLVGGPRSLPAAARKGRERLESQVNLAKFVGKFTVEQGATLLKLELAKRLAAFGPSHDADSVDGAQTRSPTPPPEPPMTQADRRHEQVIPVRREGPDASALAIPEYDALAASQVVPRLASLTPEELEAVRCYEEANRRRRTILSRVAQLQRL